MLAGNFLLSGLRYWYADMNRSLLKPASGEAAHKRHNHGTNWGLKPERGGDKSG